MQVEILAIGDRGEARILVAATFWERFRGLMGRTGIPGGHDGMAFGDSSLHTCFMRIPLDIVFIRNDEVARVAENVRPWRVVFGGRGTRAVELPAGAAARLGFAPGVRVTSRGTSRAGE